MISAWWLFLAFFVGVFFGVFVAAILCCSRSDDNEPEDR